MPLYEFHCHDCAKDFELLVRSSDWKGTPCPHCGSKKLVKQLSTFAAASAGPSGPMPCDFGGCPTPQRKRGGCCGGGPHRH